MKTLSTDAKKTTVKSRDKKRVMELTGSRDLFGRALYLSIIENLDMLRVFTYPLLPVTLALPNIEGTMHNTCKFRLASKLEASTQSTAADNVDVHVADAVFSLRVFGDRPSTFGQLAKSFLSKLMAMALLVLLMADTYKRPLIKDPERLKRGDSSEAVYSTTGPQQLVPRDWQKALNSPSFKSSLMHFLASEWQKPEYSKILVERQLYFAVDHKCYRYTARDGIVTRETLDALASDHEEADTLIMFHLHKLTQERPGLNITSRCDDVDIMTNFLYHVYCEHILGHIWMDVGKVSNNTRRYVYVDINQLIHEETNKRMFAILPGFHAFTGCDYTGPFFGKGKQRPFELLKMSSDIWKHSLSSEANQMYH